MASRVNVKFVVLLSAAVGLTFLGVAGALYYVKFRSGDRYAALAQDALAKGDVEAADKFYGRAVGKERGNVAWLRAWRDVRQKLVPANETIFRDDYVMYVSILSSLATAEKTPEAYREALEAQYQSLVFGASRQDWDRFVSFVEDFALRNFPSESPPPAVRRYRGVGIVNSMLRAPGEIAKDRQQVALGDLEAAIKADPKDVLAGTTLSTWHRLVAAQKEGANDAAGSQAEIEASRAVDRELLTNNPDEPDVLVETLAHRLMDAGKLPAGIKGGTLEAVRAQNAALAALKPDMQQVAQKLLASDPKRLDVMTLGRFEPIATMLDTKEGPALAMSVVDRALSADPTNADLLSFKANTLLDRNQYESAIAGFQKVLDLPNPPVGLAGLRLWMYRKSSVFMQADAAVRLIAQAQDDTARKAALARAQDYRKSVASRYPENAPELKIIDAKLKYFDGDLAGAQGLLTEFLRAPGDAAFRIEDAKILMADIASRTQQLGLARQNLVEVRRMREQSQRWSVDILMGLAQVDLQLKNYAQAVDECKQALTQDPDNEGVKKALALAEALNNKDAKLDDPVLQRIADADRASRGDKDLPGDDQKAIKILQDGLESSNYDPRLVAQLLQFQLVAGDKDGAAKTLEGAIAKHPDDATLKTSLERLKGAATLEGSLALIDSYKIPDLEKAIARYATYQQFGKPEEAKKALDDAAKLGPTDKRVLEYQFLAAVSAQDLAAASQVVDRAVQADADRAGGNVFKARLLLAQNNLREGIATLQKVVDKGSAPPVVYRLMGMAQLQAGRSQEGIDSLRRAIALNPSDVATIKTLIGSQAQLGRTQDALDLARASEVYARRDPEFMNMWLVLEATTGNRQFARERREMILAQTPTDVSNRAALAEIYIDQHAWDKARTLLDALKTEQPTSAQIATLDARWHAEHGDLPGARKVFQDLIAAVKAKTNPMTPEPYLVYAQFLMRFGQTAEAMDQIREAEKLQDPKTMAVTQILADSQFGMGLYGDAEETYRRMFTSGIADPKDRNRRRLIDALLQQRKFAEADKELAAIGAGADADVELLVERSEVAKGLGDRTKAADLLNTAIAKFPDEPLPFYKRARLVMSDPSMMSDAMADLATAIKLRPGLWQALRTRYGLLMQQGKTADALRDLRAAVDANPSMDNLRFELIDQLLANQQEEDAAVVADAGLKGRENDPRMLLSIAERFNNAKKYQRASRYCKQAFDALKEPGLAMLYVGALLSQTPPAVSEAETVLATPSLNIDKSWPLLMSRSLLRMKQGREDAARTDLANAVAMVGGPADLSRWYDRFRLIYPDAATAASILQSQRVQGPMASWLALFQAKCLMEASKADGLKAMKALGEQAQADSSFRVEVYKTLSIAQATDDAAGAIESCKAGLALSADDVMLNNNAASILSENLNRPQEALPYAERALKGGSNQAAVLDTMAFTLWKLGQKDKAVQTESDALRMPQPEADKVPLALKLARWKLESGDRQGAGVVADYAAGLVCDNPGVIQKYKPELDQLNKDLQSAPR